MAYACEDLQLWASVGHTCVALQLASGHTSDASSSGAGQLDTFCSVHSPTGWQRQGTVILAWLGTPPTQPAASLPTISVLREEKQPPWRRGVELGGQKTWLAAPGHPDTGVARLPPTEPHAHKLL